MSGQSSRIVPTARPSDRRSGEVPHRLDQTDAQWADVVVTMGCGGRLPVHPGQDIRRLGIAGSEGSG
jgi:hypothetical protein